MDGVQGPQRRPLHGSGSDEQVALERYHRNCVQQFACPGDQVSEGQAGVDLHGPPDGSWKLSQYQLAGQQVSLGEECPQRAAFRLVPQELHQRRRVGVEERQSAFAADLIERAAEHGNLPADLQWLRQPATAWPPHSAFGDKPVQRRSCGGGGAELGDWTVMVGHNESLPLLNEPQVMAEVLPKLGDSNRRHVQNSSRIIGRGGWAR